MASVSTILLLLALICFFAAAIGLPSRGVNLTAAGLALLTLAALVGARPLT